MFDYTMLDLEDASYVAGYRMVSWSGNIRVSFWTWIFSGVASVELTASGSGKDGVEYSVKAEGDTDRIDAGAGLGMGYITMSSSFKDIKAGLVPVQENTKAYAGFFGIGVGLPVPENPVLSGYLAYSTFVVGDLKWSDGPFNVGGLNINLVNGVYIPLKQVRVWAPNLGWVWSG